MLEKAINSKSCCAFEYLYRDAANYKAYGRIWLKGNISKLQKYAIVGKLQDGDFFIAEQLEIPALYDELYSLSSGPTNDDHVWHTFVDIQNYEANPLTEKITYWGKAIDLCNAFNEVVGWDISKSPHIEIA